MVDKSTLNRKIDVRLRSIREHLNALNWYAERYGPGPAGGAKQDATFDALHYEWGDTIDRFEGAHSWYLAGDMSEEQSERHRENLALLTTQMPLIRQLGLVTPSGALAAALEASASSPPRARPA